jgi:hypothetical protein
MAESKPTDDEAEKLAKRVMERRKAALAALADGEQAPALKLPDNP